MNAEKEKNENIRNNKLDNYIISKIICDTYSVGDLCAIAYKDGLDYSITEIKESLKRIKSKISIQNPKTIEINPIYRVYPPSIVTDSEFLINSNKKCYDILLTSDWHLDYNQDITSLVNRISKMYNYCSENNIFTIFNLGDFFNVGQVDNLKMYEENMRLIEILINIIPFDKQIRHVVLGGNHDRRMFKVGIDPIKILSDSRDDFINLGYDDSKVIFNNNSQIGLHHPGFYNIQMSNLQSRTKIIKDYLKIYYKRNNMTSKDMYIDLFGHFHSGYIDQNNNFVFVPAFKQIKTMGVNSLMHLKLYFNDSNKICKC